MSQIEEYNKAKELGQKVVEFHKKPIQREKGQDEEKSWVEEEFKEKSKIPQKDEEEIQSSLVEEINKDERPSLWQESSGEPSTSSRCERAKFDWEFGNSSVSSTTQKKNE